MGKINGYLTRRTAMLNKVEEAAYDRATRHVSALALVALNEGFGFGIDRGTRFINALEGMAETFKREACESGFDVAEEHLRRRLEKILHAEVRRVE